MKGQPIVFHQYIQITPVERSRAEDFTYGIFNNARILSKLLDSVCLAFLSFS